MPIGAFFCRAGWYRPSMRPAAPVKMTSGMTVRTSIAGVCVARLRLRQSALDGRGECT
jgi:hypothetical protein